MPKCQDCIYFDANTSYCRKGAPVAALSGSTKVVWPQVDPVNDWCAEGYSISGGYYDQGPAAREG